MAVQQISEPNSDNSPEETNHWIVLSVVVTVGILVAMLVPAITRQELHPQSLYISTTLATLSFTGIWWYRGKTLWQGAAIGAALGIVLFFIAVLVRDFS